MVGAPALSRSTGVARPSVSAADRAPGGLALLHGVARARRPVMGPAIPLYDAEKRRVRGRSPPPSISAPAAFAPATATGMKRRSSLRRAATIPGAVDQGRSGPV